MNRAKRMAVVILLALAFGLLIAPASFAREAQLSDLSYWRSTQLAWRDGGGLPVDSEFTAPLCAQYNWAYGATVLGLTTHSANTGNYYAVLGVYSNGTLDALDQAGPTGDIPQFHAGRYHLATALPDGRVYIWLTAPGANPHKLMLVNDAIPGTPIACLVYPPDPVSAEWKEWWITLAYCLNDNGPQLEVQSFRGTGSSAGYITGLALPSALNAVALKDGGSQPPQLLYAVVDTPAQGRQPVLAGVYLTAYAGNGWHTTRCMDTGSRGAVLHPGAAGSWSSIVAAMDPDSSGLLLRRMTYATPENAMQPMLGGSDYFQLPFMQRRCFLFESALSPLPMLAYSDGTDILLAWWQAPPGRTGSALGYAPQMLINGSNYPGGDAQYPVVAVAASAHWSTGNPEVYWVQQGSPGNNTGQLFRVAYLPGSKAAR